MVFFSLCFAFVVQVVVVFEISYKSPDNEAGNFEPKNLIDPIQRQYTEKFDLSDGLDDDQQKLLDIEQNIANLEKNLIRGKDLLMSPFIDCVKQISIQRFPGIC